MPLLFLASLVLIDQLTKYSVRHWGGFYICNEGIAFGLVPSPVIFWFFWISMITFILIQIFNIQFSTFNQLSISKFSMSKLPLYLILSGAISNIIDRIYFGCVIDFINIPFWPAIFNVADAFIAIGAIMIALPILKNKN
jgi:signal peptidase II